MDIVGREISNTPPVTLIYVSMCILLTLAVIWRVVTCYCFFGTLNFNFLFNLMFAYRYCRMLEETWYSRKTADFVMMFLFCGTVTCIIASFFNMLFLSHVLTMMLVYVWSRRNPFVRLNIFGIFDVNAPYLPWVFFAFSFLLGNNMTVDLIGIIVGHLYYFLEDVYPNQTNGFRLLRAPHFLNHNRDYDPIPEAQRPGGFDWNDAN